MRIFRREGYLGSVSSDLEPIKQSKIFSSLYFEFFSPQLINIGILSPFHSHWSFSWLFLIYLFWSWGSVGSSVGSSCRGPVGILTCFSPRSVENHVFPSQNLNLPWILHFTHLIGVSCVVLHRMALLKEVSLMNPLSCSLLTAKCHSRSFSLF